MNVVIQDGLPQRSRCSHPPRPLSTALRGPRIGVSRNTVLRYESGHRRPRADTLEPIARLGGVSLDCLLRGDGRQAGGGTSEWDDAVRLLRAAWREPSRRARVLRALLPNGLPRTRGSALSIGGDYHGVEGT